MPRKDLPIEYKYVFTDAAGKKSFEEKDAHKLSLDGADPGTRWPPPRPKCRPGRCVAAPCAYAANISDASDQPRPRWPGLSDIFATKVSDRSRSEEGLAGQRSREPATSRAGRARDAKGGGQAFSPRPVGANRAQSRELVNDGVSTRYQGREKQSIAVC